jgi:hypothetical protein
MKISMAYMFDEAAIFPEAAIYCASLTPSWPGLTRPSTRNVRVLNVGIRTKGGSWMAGSSPAMTVM